jgi:NDP-sugar pyrophosphorylase family protein
MEKRSVRQVPLLDDGGRVKGLATLREMIESDSLPLQAVVMAGGYGTRLRPLTEKVPKTMLKVGDKPILESILKRLRQSGIQCVNLTTHYKGEIISEHFGDGEKLGLNIHYVEEDRPLGTAGALSLLQASCDPILVMNGDILTQVDFRAMHEFHVDHKADMTVAVSLYEYQVPYGVIESDGLRIRSVSEKPVKREFINAGIYLLNPEACGYIPNGQSYDMTDLMNKMIGEGRRVISFPIREYWADIGRLDDYKQAQKDYNKVFEK